MSRIEGTYNQYELKAKNLIDSINNKDGEFNKKRAIHNYKEFLKEKLKNPVAMDIAFRDMESNIQPNDFFEYGSNFAYLERKPEIAELIKEVNKLNKNYPKTALAREAIINKGRINHGKVTPRLTGFKKLLFKLSMFI